MLFSIFIGVALVLVVATYIIRIQLLDGFIAILALVVTIGAFLTKNYTYLFDAVRKKKGNMLIISEKEAFTLAPNGNSIVRREGDRTYASAFVKIPVYKSGSEMTADEKGDIAKLFGRILTLSKNPVKISSQLYMINRDDYIKKIRESLNQAEDRYRELQSLGGGEEHKTEFERARGELTMWRNLLDNVGKSHSRSLIIYAMVSAEGGNDEEAGNLAYQRAEELSGGIGTILGIACSVANGQEILTFIEPEYMIPVEIVNERLRQKMQG